MGRGESGQSSPVLYRSDNDGQTWQAFGYANYEGIRQLRVRGDTLYTVTRPGVQISTDDGQTWTTSLQTDVLSLAVDGATLLAATRYNGVAVSTDGGQTWQTQLYRETTGQFGVALIAGRAWYAASLYQETLFYSDDKGVTWRNIGAGLPTNPIPRWPLRATSCSWYGGNVWARPLAELRPHLFNRPHEVAHRWVRPATRTH